MSRAWPAVQLGLLNGEEEIQLHLIEFVSIWILFVTWNWFSAHSPPQAAYFKSPADIETENSQPFVWISCFISVFTSAAMWESNTGFRFKNKS